MKSLLEVVGRKILTEGIPVQTSGVDRILYNLKPSTSYDLPVQTSESEWIVVQGPERLVRIFKFEDPREVKDFVTHIIFEQEEMGHHAKLIVDNRDVTVETYTHGVDGVTELDKELAKFCDDLYLDVQDFYGVEPDPSQIQQGEDDDNYDE